MDTLFKYGDFEGVYDAFDYVQAEKVDPAYDAVIKATEEMKSLSNAEALRTLVMSVAGLLNAAFGDETANKVFGKSTSAFDALLIFEAFTDFKNGQVQAAKEKTEEIKKRNSNRAQRRAVKK